MVSRTTLAHAVNTLVDDYRTQCFWFLRPDYYPATHEEQLQVLDYVQRYGDREAHLRAAALRHRILALQELPADVVIGRRMIVTKKSGEAILKQIANGKPSAALRRLMHDGV